MQPPYDNAKLDRLMDEAGVDLILAHTPHNIRYLSGGYYFHFRERIAAIGPSQYLPFVGIPKGDSTRAFQVAWLRRGLPAQRDRRLDTRRHPYESARHRGRRPDGGRGHPASGDSPKATIGVERAFMPVDAMDTLREELPDARFVESLGILEELRVIKRPDELEIFRRAGQADAEAIQEGFRLGVNDATTKKIARTVEGGMVQRGVHFHYALPPRARHATRALREKMGTG